MTTASKITFVRVLFIPVYMLLMYLSHGVPGVLLYSALALFIILSLTDYVDGHIARKYNQVTDFGKFIDPLADKFMVISSMVAIMLWMILRGEEMQALIFVWVVLIILLRELGVTSLRLVVAGKSGIVVAASMLGKIKTVSQMVGTVVLIVEPIIPFFCDNHILSYVMMAIMAFTTLFSGIDYLKAYMPYIDSNK